MSAFALPSLQEDSPRDLVRWALAAAIVVGIHAGAIAFYLRHHEPDMIGDEADVVNVELAPIDTSPDATARDVAPAPEAMIESKPVPEQPKEKPPEEAKLEQPPPPDDSTAVIPEPVEKPPETVEEARPPMPRTAVPAKPRVSRGKPEWELAVTKRLQACKRYLLDAGPGEKEGVATLAFSVDRHGRLLAHSIAQSSGHPKLDSAVMAMIEHCKPLPQFRPTMTESKIDLSVPVRFSRR